MGDRRLLLIRHGPTSATEGGTFGADEPLSDPDGVRLAHPLPAGARALCSPALRCRQTAHALGLEATVDERLREGEFGTWTGKRFVDLDPAETSAWLSDPDAAPHGGESLTQMVRRLSAWLDEQPDGDTIAVAHDGAIRAAIVHALGVPIMTFWRISVAPLGVVDLRGGAGGWALAL